MYNQVLNWFLTKILLLVESMRNGLQRFGTWLSRQTQYRKKSNTDTLESETLLVAPKRPTTMKPTTASEGKNDIQISTVGPVSRVLLPILAGIRHDLSQTFIGIQLDEMAPCFISYDALKVLCDVGLVDGFVKPDEVYVNKEDIFDYLRDLPKRTETIANILNLHEDIYVDELIIYGLRSKAYIFTAKNYRDWQEAYTTLQ